MAGSVDVVMPCYNAAAYLREAIDSVLAQQVPLRLIVVNDGSTDASEAILRGYGGAISCISQANAGIAAARNAGVGHGSAHYLAFLDADDVWLPGSLARRLDYLQAHAGADGVFAQLQQFLTPDMDPALAARLPHEATPQLARFAGTLLVRRAAFERAGGFGMGLGVGEMIEWLSRAEAAGLTFGSLQQLVLRRRIHGANTTLKLAASQAHYLRALKLALDRKRGGTAEAAKP